VEQSSTSYTIDTERQPTDFNYLVKRVFGTDVGRDLLEVLVDDHVNRRCDLDVTNVCMYQLGQKELILQLKAIVDLED
tara:strand:- start:18 stop:251 length:234 start_codon:yes stop_codon:yes gene_type:complete